MIRDYITVFERGRFLLSRYTIPLKCNFSYFWPFSPFSFISLSRTHNMVIMVSFYIDVNTWLVLIVDNLKIILQILRWTIESYNNTACGTEESRKDKRLSSGKNFLGEWWNRERDFWVGATNNVRIFGILWE